MAGLYSREKYEYVKELLEYKEQGVLIYIDGIESDEEDWFKMLNISEEECYYMPDYIEEEGVLKEIRFDKINNAV